MLEGRVTLNGTPAKQLGTKADLDHDDIRVDGVRIKPPQKPVYLLLNKPKGVVSTRHDPAGRQTVMDLVPAVAGLFPVGRLDVTTEGLLLLTNDGAFAQRVAHPRYEVPRVYQAKVRGVPTPETLARRLLEAVGHPVSKLKRVGLGILTNRGLEPGEFRHLTPREIRTLRGEGVRG